jgi:hypothetical protein
VGSFARKKHQGLAATDSSLLKLFKSRPKKGPPKGIPGGARHTAAKKMGSIVMGRQWPVHSPWRIGTF